MNDIPRLGEGDVPEPTSKSSEADTEAFKGQHDPNIVNAFLPRLGGHSRGTVQFNVATQTLSLSHTEQTHPKRHRERRSILKVCSSSTRTSSRHGTSICYLFASQHTESMLLHRPPRLPPKRCLKSLHACPPIPLTHSVWYLDWQDTFCPPRRGHPRIHDPSPQACTWPLIQEEGSLGSQVCCRLCPKSHGHKRCPN